MDCFDYSMDVHGFKHVLVVVDHTTNYVWARPLRTKRNEEVIHRFTEMITSEGIAPDVRIDNGTEFRTLPDTFAATWGGKVRRITPGKSRSNVCYSLFKNLVVVLTKCLYYVIVFDFHFRSFSSKGDLGIYCILLL